jgi:hypothetical protein
MIGIGAKATTLPGIFGIGDRVGGEDIHMIARNRTCWLGRRDSNLCIAEWKSASQPLGYAMSGSGRRHADRHQRQTLHVQQVESC